MSFESFWQQIKLNIISKNAKNDPLILWFKPTEFLEIVAGDNDNIIRLSVPTPLHQYWISQHLLETISCEVSNVYNLPYRIELVVVKQENDDVSEPLIVEKAAPTLNPTLNIVASSDESARTQFNHAKDTLNPEYTFSTFVVGRNNEFAHAVSHSIANNPGAENYNPLFICGPTGMGKTHLLNAVGNHVKERFPHLTICYCSAERFLNECISSIRRNEMHKFRQKYRDKCNILLMDDIQILGRGEAVQEEFFHTLNDFFEKGQQVIVASDRMPKDIMGLEDRIRTRLEWGLIADIQMPDLETRVAILKYKAERRGIPLPHDVASYIARISKTSIRQLEGNLNKIKMFAELQGLPISLELSRKILATHDEIHNLTIEDIQKLVADHFKVRIADMKGHSRAQPLTTARQICMSLSKKHCDKSLVEIGRAHGDRDHSTVINALRRIDSLLSTDPELNKDYKELEQRIHNLTGV